MKRTAVLAPLALLPALAPFAVLAQPAAAQQPPPGQLRFELANVHASPTAFWFAQNTNGQIRPGLISDGLYIYRDATLLSLIQAAYGVTEDTVSGGPSWLKSDLFDVVAKVPADVAPADLKLMLQSLLADRFALVVQAESRPTPRYVLAVAKGGPKLKRAAGGPGGESGCKQERPNPIVPGPDGQISIPNLKASCHNMTSHDIAEALKQLAGGYTTYLDHDIVDSTNLEGGWDFNLEWSPPIAQKGPDTISIFDAVNKQLGLTLELHDVPLPQMVVKSVNRQPTPNAPEVATSLAIPPPRFEVAVVKPMDASQRAFTGAAGPGQFKAVGTLRLLIAAAFQVQPNAAADKIVGLPKFGDTQAWDITAKYPSTGEGAPIVTGGRTVPPTQSVLLKMMLDLLADQFQLKTHTENREITVYALTVDGKHKLTKADPAERSDCRPDPNAPRPFPNIRAMANCKNITMAEFARNLEQATGFFDHPIVDETGLEGGWDFLLGFSAPNPLRTPAPGQGAPNQPAVNQQGALPDVPEGLSSYEAVQKELGLKLVKTKRSVPVIVIDHVDEKPVE